MVIVENAGFAAREQPRQRFLTIAVRSQNPRRRRDRSGSLLGLIAGHCLTQACHSLARCRLLLGQSADRWLATDNRGKH
jgi:hypothetical protein